MRELPEPTCCGLDRDDEADSGQHALARSSLQEQDTTHRSEQLRLLIATKHSSFDGIQRPNPSLQGMQNKSKSMDVAFSEEQQMYLEMIKQKELRGMKREQESEPVKSPWCPQNRQSAISDLKAEALASTKTIECFG